MEGQEHGTQCYLNCSATCFNGCTETNDTEFDAVEPSIDDLLKKPDAAAAHGLLLQSLASLSEMTTTTDAANNNKDDALEQFRQAMEQDGVL
jgi:hypothetical protein